MKLKTYFEQFPSKVQKQYEAFRLHFVEGFTLAESAKRLDLSVGYLYSAKNKASELLKDRLDPFFIEKKPGPKSRHKAEEIRDNIIELRMKNYSIIDIKVSLEALGRKISHETINEVLKEEGFARLPRRSYKEKSHLKLPDKLTPLQSVPLDLNDNAEFSTGRSGGVLAFLPLIEELGIIDAIKKAKYPETSSISSISYILSFLALKLIGNKRLSHDESWSMDRVLGFFANLNVLPKNASLSSYSYRVSRKSNRILLSELNRIFNTDQNLSDFNLDFKAIPHWGDESVLERNYSTMRGKAVKSVLALIVQNANNGMIAYTNAEITHKTEKHCIIEFVDFWKESTGACPKMLVFDSQCTIYENLNKLNIDDIKFLTLRRRTPKMLEHAKRIKNNEWEVIKVDAGKRKPRTVKVYDETINLSKYDKPIRQLIVIDHSKQPIFLLTNDFKSSPATLIRKYGHRWLVEKEIAEQIAFFHLNQLSSSIVVKVDFDLTLTLLAHNLYRCLAQKIDRHEQSTVETLHRRFIEGRAVVRLENKKAEVTLSKRSHSPLLFELPWMEKETKLSWNKCKISFKIGTTS